MEASSQKSGIGNVIAQRALTRLVLIIAGIALIAVSVQGQAFQREWVRTYSLDKGKTNMASSILSAPDGVIVAGSSQNEDGDADYFVVKYGLDGAELWRARHNSGVGVQDWFRAVTADPAGNVFVTGTTETVKFSAGGNFVWSAPFGGRALAANVEGVYLTGLSETDWNTVKLENDEMDGQVLWMRVHDGPAGDIDHSEAIVIGDDGNVMVAGVETIVKPAQGPSMLAMASKGYTPNGDIAWYTRVYSNITALSAFYVKQAQLAPDGSFFLQSNVNFDKAVILDKSGEILLDVFTETEGATASAVDTSGNMIFGGTMHDRDGSDLGFVVKLTKTGGKPWAPHLILRNVEPSSVIAVTVNSTEQVFAAGGVKPNSTLGDLLVIKLGPDLKSLASDRFDSPQHLEDTATAIAAKEDGSVYVTGWSRTAEGGTEFVTIKYSAGPKIEQRADGAMRLEFYTSPGQRYAIEATSDFFNWQSLITNTADANGVVQFDDTNGPAIPYRFYRGNSNP